MMSAANTGISAIIDGNGRIYASTELREQTMIESRLPVAIDRKPLREVARTFIATLTGCMSAIHSYTIFYRSAQR